VVPQTAVFGGYNGGLYLAAGDIDHNGRDQLVVAAGDNAPPIVQVYQVAGAGLQLQTAFVAFDAAWWRGGVRVAVGDLNRDGFADVVVTTGSELGAVSVYSGASLARGTPARLIRDFMPAAEAPFGLTATIGDLNGDGYGDLVLTFVHGPALVGVWSGAVLSRNPNTPASQLPMMATFLALPPNINGAGITTRNVNGTGRVDLVVTSADPLHPGVEVFDFVQPSYDPGTAPNVTPIGVPITAGIFVG
jgi:hypothetical protein